MQKCKALLILVSLAAMVLLGAGCSKLTKENYDKLKVGMEFKEVTALLGDAASCDGAMAFKNCTWGDEQKNITVKFVADKIVYMACKGI
jgi:hypothetical protein